MKQHALLLLSILATTSTLTAKNPIEVGLVEWGRDLDVAFAKSKTSGKPVLALFQEVPG